MRLTLRTLLAYLDGTLNPQDSEDIDLKLSNSEFAEHLVTRIIAAAKDPKLGVYALRGDLAASDLNEVAAYLDNTLASNRVADLEKRFIESDRALAEVSSCHNVLTRVIGEPARIEPALLRQAYALEPGVAQRDESPTARPPHQRESKPSILQRLMGRKASVKQPTKAASGSHGSPEPLPSVLKRDLHPPVKSPLAPVMGAADPGYQLENPPAGKLEQKRTDTVSMKRIFISHSSKDREFVERHLISLLKGAGAQPWYSRDDIRTGTHWERSIIQALRDCGWFLLVMSLNSAQSEWVRDEVHWAINHRFGAIIPVIIEECNPYDFHIRLDRIQAVNVALDPEEAFNRIVAILSASNRKEPSQ